MGGNYRLSHIETQFRCTMATRNDDELEENWAAEAVEASDDEGVLSAGSEDEFEEEAELELAPVKRSRDETGDMVDDGAADGENAAPVKKQKTAAQVRRIGKSRQISNEDLIWRFLTGSLRFLMRVEQPKKPAKASKGLHKMTQAEHFKIVNDAYVKHRGGQMTSLELADALNGALRDLACSAKTHFASPKGLGKHKLELLPAYIHHFMPKWKREFAGKGKRLDKSPYFLVLCSSALRCVEVLKHVASFKCRVGKLFAKHMKVSEQGEQLSRIFFPIAVGTPARVKKLLETDALSLKHTTHVIFDMEKDKKQLTIMELKDTATEVMDLLQFYFIPQLNKPDGMKIVLF
ncbi:hypothetical protein BBJ28_00015913 [Nothophytophthora sp. Chile5]|nr:hypothetical protein BBJ28_00015913 [Nothophytophthora sp. Chile5]